MFFSPLTSFQIQLNNHFGWYFSFKFYMLSHQHYQISILLYAAVQVYAFGHFWHTQYGFTHSYCFTLTSSILLLLLPSVFNYFKGILENLITYDFLPFIYFCWYAEKHYTKFRRRWFPLQLLVIFCKAKKHYILFNLPFCHILAYCQSFLSLPATPEFFLLRFLHCYTTILQVLTTEENLEVLVKTLYSTH